ncbi:hypothetical protein PPERSA_11105 [Pseudocohnilembus persalinus]|uniref:Uncharacterized protein n=1 Tax=Pseudocohnilembus persalinus TaxID=266149 RepID=A0A0V0QZA3_PSEPJ|nr:hypothetical protein PPERSA_11105 [Pseudocohnilembus persalinus]|eukprot:KRX07556.1 hypothetical protein PPERSA_11105 [Pseudocohnilembus persalinus]
MALKYKTFFICFVFYYQIFKVFAVDCTLSSTTTLQNCQLYCRVTYQGQKNYYNQSSQNCEVVQQCDYEQVYNSDDNICENLNQAPPENDQDEDGDDQNSPPFDDKDGEEDYINCINGNIQYINNYRYCICDEGYTSSGTYDNNGALNQCDKQDNSDDIDYSDEDAVDKKMKEIQDSFQSDTIFGIPKVYKFLKYQIIGYQF